MSYLHILKNIQSDERYQNNLDWGQPRDGHPEGTLRAHIEELEANLERLSPQLQSEERDKLRILIHVHDSFKPDSQPGVSIMHPNSHASLAKSFLSEFCDDHELLTMVQFHDEPYALWRQKYFRGHMNEERLTSLMEAINDWDLFNAFLIIDGCTIGKSRTPLEWWFQQSANLTHSRITTASILPSIE
jgi:hypothetical protein